MTDIPGQIRETTARVRSASFERASPMAPPPPLGWLGRCARFAAATLAASIPMAPHLGILAQPATFETCRKAGLLEDYSSLPLTTRLSIEFGLAGSSMAGSAVKDVSGILRPAMLPGSPQDRIKRMACALGVSHLERFKGSTAAGEVAYVGRTIVPGIQPGRLSLVLKLVMHEGVLVRAYAYLRAPASS